MWIPALCQLWHHWSVARVSREASKAVTRQRLLEQARRLFREHGYAATSLEDIAEAAEVTKGAIYAHFSSKEDLLLSAIEMTLAPEYPALLNDPSRAIRQRLREFGRLIAVDERSADRAELAVTLEFIAALLRNPEALRRCGAKTVEYLAAVAADDDDEPLPGTSRIEVWAIGHALATGLRIQQFIAPEIFTPELSGRAFELLADLYPDDS